MSKRSALHMTPAQVAVHYKRIDRPLPSDVFCQVVADHPIVGVPVSGGPLRRKRMTRAESEFELILRDRFHGAQILFEAYTLRLADDCRYTPDFAVITGLMIDFYEVKGRYIFPKALVKPRVAAEKFPQHRFFVAQKHEHGWEEYQLGRFPEKTKTTNQQKKNETKNYNRRS